MVEGSALSSDEWCTPKWLCERLGVFDLDPCSNERSNVEAMDSYALNWSGAATARMFRYDGLALDWGHKSVFVNCPYSNVTPWAEKLAAHEGPWVALLKLDPSTRWWATLMSANPFVAPFRKRIKFEGDKAMTANFPSVLVFKRWWPSNELTSHLWLRSWT